MEEVVIVEGVRTAIGSFGGSLKDVEAADLGKAVIKGVMKKAGLRPAVSDEVKSLRPSITKDVEMSEIEEKYMEWEEDLQPIMIDEVIMGCVLQGGQGQNPGRQAAIRAGIPQETNASTINKVCASGMKAVALAAQAIKAGDADLIIAGGMECMSHAPYLLPKARWGYRMDITGKGEAIDLMVYDGLYEIFYGYHMGVTAENIAREYNISRREQDEVGAESHHRALKAIKDGIFKEEIVPVLIPQRKGEPKVFDTDERPMETSVERMAKLPPAFIKDGTVTAGNASGINDAAAALIVTSRSFAEKNDLKIRATIKGYATGAVDPKYMGLGPIPATRKLLKKLDLTIEDMDVIELNEAFASQAIACMKELGIPRYGESEEYTDPGSERVNPYGSGISLGHPIGCTGARLLVTMLYEMERKDYHLGLATLCIGGGQGMAMILER
ncbi:MAG TPA: acetyl-CoA C-acetyltransferase [Candidatus Syntrophoarchaeum butanivorans]|uniref:Acetyl-CoA C-acetyltransferase n=1 Tax=Candidatus Syntropharchaeum butanivorans TaxID=1839936 RepID=A0A7C0X2S2_9EURY|nr:acetyl-CoA C-acetyltransferase [Candidatus Syntrophoarchaeum butanivorans]HEC57137.1 acetyl-CoA C-acetyltransferase [Candidatus Syntrophoarchaeum butanivorans]